MLPRKKAGGEMVAVRERVFNDVKMVGAEVTGSMGGERRSSTFGTFSPWPSCAVDGGDSTEVSPHSAAGGRGQ
jgi:hypothetical protein